MSIETLPLIYRRDHVLVELDGRLWIYDTGADTSFGDHSFSLCENVFSPARSYMGITAQALSGYLGEEVVGLMGADVLKNFDHLLDLNTGQWAVSTDTLHCVGNDQSLSFFMGVPMLHAKVAGMDVQLFFDTGAQISYFQGDVSDDHPSVGKVDDFFPGTGPFVTESYLLPTLLDGIDHTLKYGQLPGMMGMALGLAGVTGILGNEVMRGRMTGYFPRRKKLTLQP